jgi:hypothetical protein
MAAGDVLYVRGTPIEWRDSGGTAVMTLGGLAAGQSRVGARHDFGAAGALPAFFIWFGRTQFASAPTIQTGLEIYFGLWDDESGPDDAWGGIAATDTGYSSAADIARREHLTLAGVVHAPTSAVGPHRRGGYLYQPARYMSPFAHNGANQALAATGTFASLIRVTPYYARVQS